MVPWAGRVDVSYVQSDNYNTIAWGGIGVPTGYNPLDLNAPDLGTAYLPQYQDPTLGTSTIPGATALTTNLLRPYRGLGAIYDTWPRYNDTVLERFRPRTRSNTATVSAAASTIRWV